MTTLQIIGAIVVGLGFGYVMQRPQICFNRAYRTITLQGEPTMLRALALAMLIQMVGFYAFVSLGIVQLNIVPGIWLAVLVGGFFFGLSFVFAQGCSTTMWYRVGNGNMGSLLTLVGFAIGEVLTFDGFLRPLRDQLAAPQIAPANGQPATLPNLLGVSPWVVVVPVALAGAWWLWQTGRSEETVPRLGGWPWWVTGAALGVLGMAAWVFSQGTDWAYGLGIVGATGPLLKSIWQGPSILNWGSIAVLALPVGGFVAAWQRRELALQLPDLSSGLRYAISGLAMGVSAAVAGGCNIGHTFTGIPTFALSSVLASLAIFGGAVAGNWVRFSQLQNPLPAIRVER